MKTRDIHQVLTFNTTALDIYQCLMDERRHSSFTGAAAHIQDLANTPFTAYDGYIEGRNIALERGKKIIQSWRANEPEWPETHYSEAAFVLTPTEEGCRLDFYNMAVPEEVADRIAEGWHEYYWEPLRFYLER